MPIFDYKCSKCENVQEVITTSVSQKPKTVCSKCGSKKMSKLMPNKITFDLKGECWASDGYSYEYTKPKLAGEKVKSTYSKKDVQKKLESVRDSMK